MELDALAEEVSSDEDVLDDTLAKLLELFCAKDDDDDDELGRTLDEGLGVCFDDDDELERARELDTAEELAFAADELDGVELDDE